MQKVQSLESMIAIREMQEKANLEKMSGFSWKYIEMAKMLEKVCEENEELSKDKTERLNKDVSN